MMLLRLITRRASSRNRIVIAGDVFQGDVLVSRDIRYDRAVA